MDPSEPPPSDVAPGLVPGESEREVARLRARAALTQPAASGGSGLWLIVSLGLFVLTGSDNKLFDLVLLCTVILIHELGHAAAMKVFGYRDLKIFFVPFFGGAASGKKTGAPVWQQSIVLLAGPLPGLFIGVALAIAFAVTGDTRLSTAALQFVFINGFNLLPFAPLDGGRLIELALLGRHRWFAGAFTIASGAVLAAIAVVLQSVALGFLAFIALFTFSYRAKLRRAVDELRIAHGTLPTDATQVSDDVLEALDATATRMHPEQAQLASRSVSTRNLWESLAIKPPSGLGSFAILAAWGASIVVALVVVVITSVATTPVADDADATAPDAATDAAPNAAPNAPAAVERIPND
jgi:Zn-dependent protease